MANRRETKVEVFGREDWLMVGDIRHEVSQQHQCNGADAPDASALQLCRFCPGKTPGTVF